MSKTLKPAKGLRVSKLRLKNNAARHLTDKPALSRYSEFLRIIVFYVCDSIHMQSYLYFSACSVISAPSSK